MATRAIVEALNVEEEVGLGFCPGIVILKVNLLTFQGAEETLHRCVVIAVTSVTHADLNVVGGQQAPVRPTGILAAPIRVVQQALSELLKMGHNHTEIAGLLHVHKSTVGRDINRNRGRRGYRPRQADQKACNRRKTPRRIVRIQWDEVDALLRQDWSPEQVSGWLKTQEHKSVSHEWIYQHILADKHSGGDLYRHLRCQKQRRKSYGCYDRRGTLPNRVSIDKRPEIVNSRQRLGDWEVDTVIGKGQQQAIVTLTERKSRLALIRKVEKRTAQAVKDAILVLLPSRPSAAIDGSDPYAHFRQWQGICSTPANR